MNFLKRKLRKFLSRYAKKNFSRWERLGLHLTPCHFYEPVPIVSELKDEIWEHSTHGLGISINEEYQLEFLNNICGKYKADYDGFGLHEPRGDCPYISSNGNFEGADGDVLYCMIRNFKPKTLIEVGSGWSTILSSYALEKNAKETGEDYQLIAIEPYPREILKDIGKIRFIEKKVQEVDLELFESLQENDILFLDSTHVVNIGSDVCFEFLEILPRLKKGVLIHVHDIFFPFEYPKVWVRERKLFWNEAYLLQAFLMYNNAFEVLWAGNWMNAKHPDLFVKMLGKRAVGSFWMRKTI